MSQIRITPEELYQGAKDIKAISDEILQNLSKLKSTVDTVAHNWEGAAKGSYIQSFETIYQQFGKTFPETIEGLANQMEEVGKALEETDTNLSNAFSAK